MPTRGDRIRAARIAAGLSQTDLARATAVGERTISRIERDNGGSPRSARRLERHLGLPDADTGGDTGATGGEADLSQVSALALVAEISRRLEVAERAKQLPRDGPPVRVRFRTKDGPGAKSDTTQSPEVMRSDREHG